jgi:hypothetical protein
MAAAIMHESYTESGVRLGVSRSLESDCRMRSLTQLSEKGEDKEYEITAYSVSVLSTSLRCLPKMKNQVAGHGLPPSFLV